MPYTAVDCTGLSARECLNNAITSCSHYSNPLEACFREGLNIFFQGGQTFWVPGVLALLISFFIIAIAYMLAEFLRSPELNAWAKNELYEVAVSAVIFGAVIASLATLNGVLSPLVANGETHIQVGYDYLSETANDLKVTYTKLLVFDAAIGTLGSVGTSSFLPFFGVGSLALWGMGVSPLAGLGQVTNAVVTIADFVVVVLINLWAQQAFLDFVEHNLLALFLPFGLLLRTFPVTRRLGSTIIAFVIAAYIVFPLTLALDKGMYDEMVQNVLMLQKYPLDISGGAIAGFESAATVEGMHPEEAQSMYPKILLTCPKKTIDDDTETAIIFKMFTLKAEIVPDSEDYDDDDSTTTRNGFFEVFATKRKDENGNDAVGAQPKSLKDEGWDGCKGIYLNSDFKQKECKGEFDELGLYKITVHAEWQEPSPTMALASNADAECVVAVTEKVGGRSWGSWVKKMTAWATFFSSVGFAASMVFPVGSVFQTLFGISTCALGGCSPNYMVTAAYDFLTCDKNLYDNSAMYDSTCFNSPILVGIGGLSPSWSLPAIMAKTSFVLLLTVVSIIISVTFFRSVSGSIGGESTLAGLSKLI